MRRIHKWLAVSAGVFLIVWLLSGITMISGHLIVDPWPHDQQRASIDFHKVLVSPGEVVARLGSQADHAGREPEVRRMNLVPLHHRMLYQVELESGKTLLVEADTGHRFEVTSAFAVQRLREGFAISSELESVDLVHRHDLYYSWGPLPVYRASFTGNSGTWFFFAPGDGSMRRSDGLSAVLMVLEGLHTFEPIMWLTGRKSARDIVLVFFSLVGVAAAGTGYYLAFKRSGQKKT